VEHFNQYDHSLRKNFGFFIFKKNITNLCDRFKKNITNLCDRFNLENRLQHLCLNLNIPLLNDRIADKYLYKNQIYLFR